MQSHYTHTHTHTHTSTHPAGALRPRELLVLRWRWPEPMGDLGGTLLPFGVGSPMSPVMRLYVRRDWLPVLWNDRVEPLDCNGDPARPRKLLPNLMGRLLADAGGVYGSADGESLRNSNCRLLWLCTDAASLCSSSLASVSVSSPPAPATANGFSITGGGGGVLGLVFAISLT